MDPPLVCASIRRLPATPSPGIEEFSRLNTIRSMKILAGAGTYVATTSIHWEEHLEVPDLSCGTYSLPAGGTDSQSPHTEDELYLVTRGMATLRTPNGTAPMRPGDVAFVPAGEEHRFVDIVEDFAVVVVFGPAEYSRAQEAGSSY
jgi:mannose-6-phosphate isomerase-like protein (cupin superfamily)